jgi:hypothetical protein
MASTILLTSVEASISASVMRRPVAFNATLVPTRVAEKTRNRETCEGCSLSHRMETNYSFSTHDSTTERKV